MEEIVRQYRLAIIHLRAAKDHKDLPLTWSRLMHKARAALSRAEQLVNEAADK